MAFLIWIVFGAVVGWVASLIMKSNQGPLLDIVVGIVGALIGGYVMSLLGAAPGGGINLYSFLVALLGAVILIAIVRAFRRV